MDYRQPLWPNKSGRVSRWQPVRHEWHLGVPPNSVALADVPDLYYRQNLRELVWSSAATAVYHRASKRVNMGLDGLSGRNR